MKTLNGDDAMRHALANGYASVQLRNKIFSGAQALEHARFVGYASIQVKSTGDYLPIDEVDERITKGELSVDDLTLNAAGELVLIEDAEKMLDAGELSLEQIYLRLEEETEGRDDLNTLSTFPSLTQAPGAAFRQTFRLFGSRVLVELILERPADPPPFNFPEGMGVEIGQPPMMPMPMRMPAHFGLSKGRVIAVGEPLIGGKEDEGETVGEDFTAEEKAESVAGAWMRACMKIMGGSFGPGGGILPPVKVDDVIIFDGTQAQPMPNNISLLVVGASGIIAVVTVEDFRKE